MTEPTDPLDRRLRDGLRAEDDWLPDVGAARHRLAAARSRRVVLRRSGAVATVGLAVAALIAVPAALRDGGHDTAPALGVVPSVTPSLPVPTCLVQVSPGVIPRQRADCVAVPSGTKASATSLAEPEPSPSNVRATGQPEPQPAPQPSKSALPSPTATEREAAIVEVTEEDSGRTIQLKVGDFLVVSLHGSEGFPWTPPESTHPTVLALSGRSTSDGGYTQEAKFVARTIGDSRVTATQDPTCRNATPQCGAPSRAFEIAVHIT